MKHTDKEIVSDDLVLNYHLMHPGGDSAPGDPNVAYYFDGVYHLHYILRHPWQNKTSYSFVLRPSSAWKVAGPLQLPISCQSQWNFL